MRIVAVVSCVVLASASLTALQSSARRPGATQRPAAAAPAKMSNADIIEMVSAGLSDEIIVGAVRQAPGKDFDLSAMGLVALKKGGVSDRLILFLQTGDFAAPAAAAEPALPASSSSAAAMSATVPSLVRGEDGVYLTNGAEVRRIEAKAPYQTRTGSRLASRLTLGIKKARLNAMLPGVASELQVAQTPAFLVHLAEGESIGEYYLLRFTVKEQQGRRELEVGSAGLGRAQAGFAENDIFLLDVQRLDKNIYNVTPKSALPEGEYGLLVIPQATGSGQTALTPRKIFDFGVR